MTHTIGVDDNQSNRSFHSGSSRSHFSLEGKVVEKVRKNSYNDIAFPVETESSKTPPYLKFEKKERSNIFSTAENVN